MSVGRFQIACLALGMASLAIGCVPSFNAPANKVKKPVAPAPEADPSGSLKTVYAPHAVGGGTVGTSPSFRVTGAVAGWTRNTVGTSSGGGMKVIGGPAGQQAR